MEKLCDFIVTDLSVMESYSSFRLVEERKPKFIECLIETFSLNTFDKIKISRCLVETSFSKNGRLNRENVERLITYESVSLCKERVNFIDELYGDLLLNSIVKIYKMYEYK